MDAGENLVEASDQKNGFGGASRPALLGEVVASDVRNESTLRSVGPRDQHMGIAMANHPTAAAYRKTPRILQFRLWTIFVAMAAVAVLAALANLFGNDGLFLGSIGVPLITGLVLIRGPIERGFSLSVRRDAHRTWHHMVRYLSGRQVLANTLSWG